MADYDEEDFDSFEDIDDMDGMEGFEDAENNTPGDERSAAMNTFKGASSSFIDDFKDTPIISQVSDVADSAFQAAAGAKVAKNYNTIKHTLSREYGKSKRDIKAAAKPFIKKLKQITPDDGMLRDILNKVDGLVGKDRDTSEESEEQRIAREANELTGSLFAEQSKRDILNQTLASMGEKSRDELLKQIVAVATTQLDFHNHNTLGYYKKSIELKYRHLFETKRMFSLQVKSFETFKRQFETIVKNTGLPEFIKIRGLEAVKQEVRNKAVGAAYESFTNNNSWVSNAKENITNRFRSVTEGITDGLTMGSEGLEMVGDLGDQLEDEDQRNMLLGSMAADGTRTIGGRIMGKVFGKTKRGKEFRDWIERVNVDPSSYFGDMAENSTGIKKFLAGSAANITSLDDNYTNYKDIDNEDLDAASYFDIRTRKSINVVIPGLLGKIFGSIEGIRTGNAPDGITYDFDKDVFTSDSKVKDSVLGKLTNGSTKKHTAKIEALAKNLLTVSRVEMTPEELRKFAARLASFGIRNKDITLSNLEEKGFFAQLDPRTAMIYRSVFENLGKEEDGTINYNIRDMFNKQLGSAVNIKSDPTKLIKKLMDEGHTDSLAELGIIKWDSVKQSYVIDKAKFDMYSIKGINAKLFEDTDEELVTDNDALRDNVRKSVHKTKEKTLDKLGLWANKLIDPVMDEIAKIEKAYDDPESKSKLRTVKEALTRAKKEATGDIDSDTKDIVESLVTSAKEILADEFKAVGKGKSKWQAAKDANRRIKEDVSVSGIGSSIKDDAKNIAENAAKAAKGANEVILENHEVDVLKNIRGAGIHALEAIEKMVIRRYLLDPKADAETIKAMRDIVYSNFAALDEEDIKSLSPSGIRDIYSNIIEDIEAANLHLKGVNSKQASDDIKQTAQKAKEKVKSTYDSFDNPKWLDTIIETVDSLNPVNILTKFETKLIEEYGYDPVSDKEVIKEVKDITLKHIKAIGKIKNFTPANIEKAYKDIREEINVKGLHLKGVNGKKILEDAKKTTSKKATSTKSSFIDKFSAMSKPKWVDELLTSVQDIKLKENKPKFGIFDKDKDGDRDGGYKDRLEFFKRSKKKKVKEQDSNPKKKGKGGILGLLTGALGIGGAAFAAAFSGIASALMGLPGMLGGIFTGIKAIGSIASLGFAGLTGVIRLAVGAMGLAKSGFLGLGKADKWLGPKLRKLVKFPFTSPKKAIALAIGGSIASAYSGEIVDGAKKAWGSVFGDDKEKEDIMPDFAGNQPAGNNIDYLGGDLETEEGDTNYTAMGSVGLAAGLGAKALHTKLKATKVPTPSTTKAGKMAATKIAAKTAAKLVPLLSGVIYTNEAFERFKDGNYVGSAASGTAAVLSTIFPWVGGAAGIALSAMTETGEPRVDEKGKPLPLKEHKVVPLKKTGINPIHTLLLNRIAKGEVGSSSPNMYNTTLGFGKWMRKGDKPITSMTITEIYSLQARMVRDGAASNAVGRYQIINITLKDIVKALKIDISKAIYSPVLQDMLILKRLYSSREYGKWLKGEITNDMFILNLSKEFASIASPIDTTYKGKPVYKGKSFYGQGVHTTLEDMRKTLNAMKKQGGSPEEPAEADDNITNGAQPTKKVSGFAKDLLSMIEILFNFFGVETKKHQVSPDKEQGDGTPVHDAPSSAREALEKKPSTGAKETIAYQGPLDIGQTLCGFKYKHVRISSAAGPEILPKYLVIHNTDGFGVHLDGMKSRGVGTALWIDKDGTTTLVNKLTNRTWHVGPTKNLKGGSSQKVRSSNSIGIEMVCRWDKKKKVWPNYTKAQRKTLRKIAACVMKKFKIPISNVYAHIEVAYKTEGEGSEGADLIRGMPTILQADTPPDTIANTVDSGIKTLPPMVPLDGTLPDKEQGDGTPVHVSASPAMGGVYPTGMSKEAIAKLKTIRKNTAEGHERRMKEDSTQMDIDAVLKDIDLKLNSQKDVLDTFSELNDNMVINNNYQKIIAENVSKGTKVNLVIKDEKGKELKNKKSLVAPDIMEFERPTL